MKGGNKMNKIAKYAIGACIAFGSLTGGYFIGANQGYGKGYGSGRQNAVNALEKVAGWGIANCEHNAAVYKKIGSEDLAKQKLDERSTLIDIISTVKNDSVLVDDSK